MKLIPVLFMFISINAFTQNVMTPETLWKLGRVTGLGLSRDGNQVVYSVSTPSIIENKSTKETFVVPVTGGAAIQIFRPDSVMGDKNISPDGKSIIYHKEVKIM